MVGFQLYSSFSQVEKYLPYKILKEHVKVNSNSLLYFYNEHNTIVYEGFSHIFFQLYTILLFFYSPYLFTHYLCNKYLFGTTMYIVI